MASVFLFSHKASQAKAKLLAKSLLRYPSKRIWGGVDYNNLLYIYGAEWDKYDTYQRL